jgi:hypothetical protein
MNKAIKNRRSNLKQGDVVICDCPGGVEEWACIATINETRRHHLSWYTMYVMEIIRNISCGHLINNHYNSLGGPHKDGSKITCQIFSDHVAELIGQQREN